VGTSFDFGSLLGGGDSTGKKFSSAASQSNIGGGADATASLNSTPLYLLAVIAALALLALIWKR
jgi:hypothetical protein